MGAARCHAAKTGSLQAGRQAGVAHGMLPDQHPPVLPLHCLPACPPARRWNAVIFGPDGTVWDGGVFKLSMEFSEGVLLAPGALLRSSVGPASGHAACVRALLARLSAAAPPPPPPPPPHHHHPPPPTHPPARPLQTTLTRRRWSNSAQTCSTPTVSRRALQACGALHGCGAHRRGDTPHRTPSPLLRSQRLTCSPCLLPPAVYAGGGIRHPANPVCASTLLSPPCSTLSAVCPCERSVFVLPPSTSQSTPTAASAWTSCKTSGAPSTTSPPSSPPSSRCSQTQTPTPPPTLRWVGWLRRHAFLQSAAPQQRTVLCRRCCCRVRRGDRR